MIGTRYWGPRDKEVKSLSVSPKGFLNRQGKEGYAVGVRVGENLGTLGGAWECQPHAGGR